MYVCMYVAIRRQCMCSSCSMCVCMSQFSKDCQRRSHVNSNCSSPKQEPVPELNNSMNSKRVIARRDLENSLLKVGETGLSSTLLFMIIVSIKNDCAVLCKACTVHSVVSLSCALHVACAAHTAIRY